MEMFDNTSDAGKKAMTNLGYKPDVDGILEYCADAATMNGVKSIALETMWIHQTKIYWQNGKHFNIPMRFGLLKFYTIEVEKQCNRYTKKNQRIK